MLRAAGFQDMLGWERMFWHPIYRVILSACVDDFKIAGIDAGVAKAWRAIRGPDRLVLDDPTPFGPYLGCEQVRGTCPHARVLERRRRR